MNNNRFDGVHNVIGKLVDTDSSYQTAIGVALGGAANYLVVDTSYDAKEMVKYLKENKLGRASFYPIDTIESRYIDSDTLSKIDSVNGYVDVLSNLVECDDIYRNIIRQTNNRN